MSKKKIPEIKITNASYVDGYRLSITFTTGESKIVDFKPFLDSLVENSFMMKYKKTKSNFKKFAIEDGDIVWGNNWDMIFPAHHLYKGNILV